MVNRPIAAGRNQTLCRSGLRLFPIFLITAWLRASCVSVVKILANPAKPATQVFQLTPELEKQTLAKALRHWLAGRPWSKVQKLIESGCVMVSGNVCKDIVRRLQAGDVVKLLPQPAPNEPQEHDIRVQYLDEHVIVVEKPAGMTTNRHRDERRWSNRRKQIQPTLDELLPQIIAKIEGRKGHRGVPLPVRAVHRIDRDTSGLIVFARTHSAEQILAQQFRQHATHRRYLAIVEGIVKAQTIQIAPGARPWRRPPRQHRRSQRRQDCHHACKATGNSPSPSGRGPG